MTDEELSAIRERLTGDGHECAETRACGWCCLKQHEADIRAILAEVERLRIALDKVLPLVRGLPYDTGYKIPS